MKPPGQPPPPQFSPDGLFWWDGVRWTPRGMIPSAIPPPAAPAPMRMPMPPPYYSSGLPSYLAPAPGLRIVLVIALVLQVGLTGFLGLIFSTSGVSEGSASAYILAFAFLALFGLTVAGLIGVVIRSSWSRWVAIAAGILICWTVVGLLLGVPILIAAARAPDLSGRPAA